MNYTSNILGAYDAISAILNEFERYGIHATWGVAGAIAYKNIEEFIDTIPSSVLDYDDSNLSPYNMIDDLKRYDPKLLFAPELIKLIESIDHQEISSHTYSHYYCLDNRQNEEAFSHDLDAFNELFPDNKVKSIVFPRNQLNKDYVPLMKEHGFSNYRGTEKVWFNNSASAEVFKKKCDVYCTSWITTLVFSDIHTVELPSKMWSHPTLWQYIKNLRKSR